MIEKWTIRTQLTCAAALFCLVLAIGIGLRYTFPSEVSLLHFAVRLVHLPQGLLLMGLPVGVLLFAVMVLVIWRSKRIAAYETIDPKKRVAPSRMQVMLKRLAQVLALAVTALVCSLVIAAGWVWWRDIHVSRTSVVNGPQAIEPEAPMNIVFRRPKKRLRPTVVVVVALADRCKSARLAGPQRGDVLFPDGRKVNVTMACQDTAGARHGLYLYAYNPASLSFKFEDPPTRERKFASLEIQTSDRLRVQDIVWTDVTLF